MLQPVTQQTQPAGSLPPAKGLSASVPHLRSLPAACAAADAAEPDSQFPPQSRGRPQTRNTGGSGTADRLKLPPGMQGDGSAGCWTAAGSLRWRRRESRSGSCAFSRALSGLVCAASHSVCLLLVSAVSVARKVVNLPKMRAYDGSMIAECAECGGCLQAATLCITRSSEATMFAKGCT